MNDDGDKDWLDLTRICEKLIADPFCTQRDVASELDLSEKRVSELARKAREERWLSTVFHPPCDRALASRLQKALDATLGRGRIEVHVVQVGIAKDSAATRVAAAAARYFEANSNDAHTIVVDGGLTVAALVGALADNRFHSMTIAPIAADPPSYDVSAYELMTRLSVKYPTGVTCAKPPFWRGAKLDRLKHSVRSRALQANFVFLGAGPLRPSFTALSFVEHLGIPLTKFYRAYRGKVAAMAGYCAIGPQGEDVRIPEIDDRMPRSLDYHDLQRLAARREQRVVLTAASRAKAEAVAGVIKARICNTIFVDDDLAVALLSSFFVLDD